MDLSLEVSGKKVNSLYDSLSEYTRKETLDAENKWKCSGCKKRVCATKQLTIFRPPLTLCIQLKRFAFGGGSGGFTHHQGFSHFAGKGMGTMRGGSKVQKQIEFPATLKLPLSDGRKCEYILAGIVNHIGGSATSGHYTAFVRRTGKQDSTQWLSMDDSFVEPVSEKTVLRNKDAYVLFYCRKEVELELPSLPPLPPRSYANAEEAVQAGDVKSKAKAKARADSITASNEKESASVTPNSKHKESRAKESSLEIGKEKVEKKAVQAKVEEKKESSLAIGKEKVEKKAAQAKVEEKKEKPPSPPQSDDGSSSDSSGSSSSVYLTPDEEPSEDTSESKNLAKSPSIPKHSDSPKASSNATPPEPKTAEVEEKAEPASGKKKKDITLDLGSRGKVKVLLGKLKKAKKPWKPSVPTKFTQNKASGLLGNKIVSGWDDDDDGEGEGEGTNEPQDKRTKATLKKEAKLREHIFEEAKQKEKSRKRKMYQDNWDAGLDAGKVKKVKEKQPSWEDEVPKENAFHRIQESMMMMKRGKAKGHETSMKKRPNLKK